MRKDKVENKKKKKARWEKKRETKEGGKKCENRVGWSQSGFHY